MCPDLHIKSDGGRQYRDGLDGRPQISDIHRISLNEGRLSRGHFRRTGASAVPARGWMRSAPGRLWGTGRPAKGPVCTERAKPKLDVSWAKHPASLSFR